jgi:hypothetical protein
MPKERFLKKPHARSSPRFQVMDTKSDVDFDQLQPLFSLKHIQYRKDYCISQCNEESKSLILEKLLKISQLTWRRIKSEPREGLGCEIIPQNKFIATLPPIITPEVTILVFRYSKAGRIAGYRDKDVYHVLLVGPDLYAH